MYPAFTAGARRLKWQLPGSWAMGGLAALAGVFLWLYLDTQQNWRAVNAQNADLLATLDAQRAASDQEAADWRERLDTERAERRVC